MTKMRVLLVVSLIVGSVAAGTAVPAVPLAEETRVIPVVASIAGKAGANFRTSVQLHNPGDVGILGRLVFHPQGRPGADTDPFLSFVIPSKATVQYQNLLAAMGQTGIGSADLVVPTGTKIETVVRIFNDAGEKGTAGMTEPQVGLEDSLQPGQRGVLIAPVDLVRTRFNIGMRSLAGEVAMTITAKRPSGMPYMTLEKTFPPNSFLQADVVEFLGFAVGPSDTISFSIDRGTAVIYGATNDNVTNDPSMQIAHPLSDHGGATAVVPVVALTPGAFDALFRTEMQIHNPTLVPISGRMSFHKQNTPPTSQVSIDYSLGAGQTFAYGDLLVAMGTDGVGTLDIVPSEGDVPLTSVRVFNDWGSRGTAGLTETEIPTTNAILPGGRAVLIAPVTPSSSRFNVGIRALGEGATFTVTVRDLNGQLMHNKVITFDPSVFQQVNSKDLLDYTVAGSDTLTFAVESGSAIIYGATTDNITQDPSIQVAKQIQ